jgi:calcium-dependent protein kinase
MNVFGLTHTVAYIRACVPQTSFSLDDDHNDRIKVIDFGLSKKFLGEPGIMTERVGTIYTMAPQVLQGIYSSQADLWSLGVITYMLLSSSKPFHHKRRRILIDLIMRGEFHFASPVWANVSESAQNFVSRLLVVDPEIRMDATTALKHPWIVNRAQLPDEIPSEEILSVVDDCLLHYRQTSTLKKLALNVIAHRSTADDILQLRQAFDAFDATKDGIITFEEFKEALKNMNYSDETVKEIFSSVVGCSIVVDTLYRKYASSHTGLSLRSGSSRNRM